MAVHSATISRVASAAADTVLLAANTGRMGAYLFNESSAVLYVKFGLAASVTSYTVQIAAGGYYELPNGSGGAGGVYRGPVNGIWASANGFAMVTEAG